MEYVIMTPEQFEIITDTIKSSIEVAVKQNVNGKIDNLKHQLDDYIKEDNAWKETALPIVKLGWNVIGFGKVLAYICGTVISVVAVYKIFA